MMGLEDYDRLLEDIKQNGLKQSIVLYKDQILDGRNRYQVCLDNGLPMDFVEYTGSDPLGHVISLNLTRRHLDASQRSLIAGRIATLKRGRPGENPSADGISVAQAAKVMSVGTASVERAKAVLKSGNPGLIAAVESGAVSVTKGAKIAQVVQYKGIPALQRKAEAGEISPRDAAVIAKEERGTQERLVNSPDEERRAAIEAIKAKEQKQQQEWQAAKARDEQRKEEFKARAAVIVAEFKREFKDTFLAWWLKCDWEIKDVITAYLERISESAYGIEDWVRDGDENEETNELDFEAVETLGAKKLVEILYEGEPSTEKDRIAKRIEAKLQEVRGSKVRCAA
ncbi:MAG: hypothetical protein WBX25_05150 [Rhodomicrobium sp.]